MPAKGQWIRWNCPLNPVPARYADLDLEQTLIDDRKQTSRLQQSLLAIERINAISDQPTESWLYLEDQLCLALICLHQKANQVDILSLALRPEYTNIWPILWRRLKSTIPAADWRYEQAGFFRSIFQECGWISGYKATDSLYWLDRAQVLTPDFRFAAPAIQWVHLPGLAQQAHKATNKSFQIDALRLDQLHPLLTGNKWFKLRWHLIKASAAGRQSILTLGGAYSNHLLATAAAGALLGYRVTVMIRGEVVLPLNPLLQSVQRLGADLIYCSRSDFRDYRSANGQLELQRRYPDHWQIPEGGADALGRQGAQEIWDYIPARYQQIASATGTASTLAGLIQGAPEQTGASVQLLGIAVLKGAGFLITDLQGWLGDQPQTIAWQILTDYHARGYAKTNPELRQFLADFQALNPDFAIEAVYTGKLFWALDCLAQQQKICMQNPLLALHTGGVYPWTPAKHVI